MSLTWVKSATSSWLGARPELAIHQIVDSPPPGRPIVARPVFWRRTPCQRFRRSRHSTLDLATGMPSRCRCATSSAIHTASPACAGRAHRFAVASQNRGDDGVPQGPLRGRPLDPGVERLWSDRHTVLGKHAADRSDPETVPVLGKELPDRTGQRYLRGSFSRTEKGVAAFKISILCSNSALRRFSARISKAVSLETPSRVPSSTYCRRIQLRNVSAVIPSLFDTAVIAAHSLG